MNSYFLRLAYSYDNKYMATVTGRRRGIGYVAGIV